MGIPLLKDGLKKIHLQYNIWNLEIARLSSVQEGFSAGTSSNTASNTKQPAQYCDYAKEEPKQKASGRLDAKAQKSWIYWNINFQVQGGASQCQDKLSQDGNHMGTAF